MQREPITIERIDAEVNGKVIMPKEKERVRHVVLAEEGNPKVPVFTGYRNVLNNDYNYETPKVRTLKKF